ncbi:MAG: hypothetical protein ACYTF3_05395 [Planctomycetota bacterium]|jgi:hypothetical protein
MLRLLPLLLFLSCSTATFLPPEWHEEGVPVAAQGEGAALLAAMRQAHGAGADAVEVELEVRDRWESTLLRWFTPLDANDQTFDARLRLDPPQVLAEDWKGLYPESFHRYLFLPLLPDLAEPAALPHGAWDGIGHRKLWVRLGEDEMVLWLHPTTMRVDRADITYREVTRGYRGTLLFPGWREFPTVDGATVLLPPVIQVHEADAGDLVHRFDLRTRPGRTGGG